MSNKAKWQAIFSYFEEIASIPHGSGNMEKITAYCLAFAQKNNLQAESDAAGNVIIRKAGTKGYENHAPVILQGHLDMVCQKTEENTIDFDHDGLSLYTEGDFLRARGTTLGADNGVAISMIMALLTDTDAEHPPLEAVFTTDEEIGMIGAGKLDFSKLSARRMINLDAGGQDKLTVSCAGGSDLRVRVPLFREEVIGTKVTIHLRGLLGGHSGVEIDKGRVNAGVLAGRVLLETEKNAAFSLLSVRGGDKANAIMPLATIELVTKDKTSLLEAIEIALENIKAEISDREPQFAPQVITGEEDTYSVLTKTSADAVMHVLLSMPNGVLDMSAKIEGLVETSLNLGILNTEADEMIAHYALRSSKASALQALSKRLSKIAAYEGWEHEAFGYYSPWEYNENSPLQALYKDVYQEQFGKEPVVEAIHAGLECGLFASNLKGLDCIAIGPNVYDVHTVHEKLSMSSTEAMYHMLINLLKKM